MSWFDAHESLVMEMAVRDRVDNLRSTIDVTPPAEDRSETPRALRDSGDEDAPPLCRRAFAAASR